MKKILILLTIALALLPGVVVRSAEVEQLNQQISANRERLDKLQKQIDDYKNLIATKQAEVNSLKRQLIVLDDKVAQFELDIEANSLKLETVGLEIDAISQEINTKDQSIEGAKGKVAEVLRQLYMSDQRSLIEI